MPDEHNYGGRSAEAPMIDLTLLKHFIAVARAASFTRAATELHVSQPVVSRSIDRLEKSLGVKLFERTTRNVRLTPAGDAFLSEAASIVDRLAVAWNNAQRIGQGAKGELKIAVCPATEAETPRLSRAMQAFRESWPQVNLQLAPVFSDAQPSLLRAAEFDIGVLRRPASDGAELEWSPLAREQLGLALPRVWGLGERRRRLTELADRPWVMPHPRLAPDAFRRQVELCRTAGFEPKVTAYVEDALNGRIMIACGVGAAFAFVRPGWNPNPDVEYALIDGLSETSVSEIAVAWAKGSISPQVRAFVQCLVDAAPAPETAPTVSA
jgi:DNA-binding transcriptional LysR family regulator